MPAGIAYGVGVVVWALRRDAVLVASEIVEDGSGLEGVDGIHDARIRVRIKADLEIGVLEFRHEFIL